MLPKLDIRSILILDAGCAAFFTLLAILFPSIAGNMMWLTGSFIVLFFLHLLIVPIKGFNFILWNAPPDSAVKYYAFLAIGISAYFGETVKNFISPYIFFIR